jgi:hypothetical protein
MKLINKSRKGAYIKKSYDTARTPYRRTLESSSISLDNKRILEATSSSLNPAALKREIECYQNKLRRIRRKKNILINYKSDKMEVLTIYE